MIRAVLAVAVATALLGIALPVLDDARRDRSARAVRGEVATIERAADSLLAADETAPGRGARRTVDVALPGGSWGSADVDGLVIRGSVGTSRSTSSVRYRIDGGSPRTVAVDAPLYTPSGPVEVSGGRRGRLVLELARFDGRPVVVVRRSDQGTATLRFMTESVTTPSHVHPRPNARVPGGVRV